MIATETKEKEIVLDGVESRNNKRINLIKGSCDEKDDFVPPLPKGVEPLPKGTECVVADLVQYDMLSESIESYKKGTPMPFMPSFAKVSPFDLRLSSEKKRVNMFLDEMEKSNTEKAFFALGGALITMAIIKLLPS